MSKPRLTPFSYVVLTLVGRSGATAPELVEMMSRGRLYWTAPRSQWYAEPKRLADLGLLTAAREPGATTDRTRYAISPQGVAALDAWVRTPASMPAVKNEAIVRVMAADLVEDPAAIREGLYEPLRAEIAANRSAIATAVAAAQRLDSRERYLLLQHELATDILDAVERWLERVEPLLDPEPTK